MSKKEGKILVCCETDLSVDKICAEFVKLIKEEKLDIKVARWMTGYYYEENKFDESLRQHIVPNFKTIEKYKDVVFKDSKESYIENTRVTIEGLKEA
jgi:hypothetical protein